MNTHQCTSRKEGNKIIFHCDLCGMDIKEYNQKTGEVKTTLEALQNQYPHTGTFVTSERGDVDGHNKQLKMQLINPLPVENAKLIREADRHIANLLENGRVEIPDLSSNLRHAIMARLYSEHLIRCIVSASKGIDVPISTKTAFYDWDCTFELREPSKK